MPAFAISLIEDGLMTDKMDSDETVFREMAATPPTEQELRDIRQLIDAWRVATEEVGPFTTRLVFMACMHIVVFMGPAYCRLGEVFLRSMVECINSLHEAN